MRNTFLVGWKIYFFLISIFFFTQNTSAQILSEGFEGGVFPPAAWAKFDNGIGLANSWGSSTHAYAGAKAAYVEYETLGGTVSEDWLVTPAFTPTANEFMLRFYQKQTYLANYGTIYEIRVSTTSQTLASSFTTIASYGEGTFDTTYSQKTVNLSAYIGQSIYVAFVEVQDDGDDWYLDNISTFSMSGTVDVNVTSVDAPANKCTFSNSELVMVNLTNTGIISIVPGAASVDLIISGANTSVLTLTNTTTITQGGTEMLMFMADLSNAGTNNITATVTLANDPNTANNTATTSNMSYGTSLYAQNVTICQGEGVVVGTNTYTNSGTYTDVLTTNKGCDSIVTTVVTVNPMPPVNPTSTVTICSCVTLDVPATNVSYLWSTGDTTPTISVCTSGIVTVNVTGANGCMNIQTTNVVSQAPSATFTSAQVNNAALVNFTSTTTGGITPMVYAWNFGDPASGANNTSALENPSHTYTTNGNYNVSLTISNTCDTVLITNLVTISSVGMEDNLLEGEFSIYPNPNNGTFTINSEHLQAANLAIEMFNLQGQMVYSHLLSNVNGFVHKVEMTTLAKGIYMVKVSDGTRNAYRKVVIE